MPCLERPLPGTPLFGWRGLDTLIAFGLEPGMSFLATLIQCIALLAFAYRTWLSAGARKLPVMSLMRTICILYCAGTAIFFFFLTTQLNKVVIVLAGFHNLLEWALIICLAFKGPLQRQMLALAILWIWAVWLCVMEIHDTLLAFIFEEVLGIWPDYILMIATWLAYYHEPGESKPGNFKYCLSLWRWGALFHMLQIYTLLFQGFGLLSGRTARIFMFVTALPNYYYYSELGLRWDGFDEEPGFLPPWNLYCVSVRNILNSATNAIGLPIAQVAVPVAVPHVDQHAIVTAHPIVADGSAAVLASGNNADNESKADAVQAAAPVIVAEPQIAVAHVIPIVEPIKTLRPPAGTEGRVYNWKTIAMMMLHCLLLSFATVLGPIWANGICPNAGQPCMSMNGNMWSIRLYQTDNPALFRNKLQDLMPTTLGARGNMYHSVFAGYRNADRDFSGDFLVVDKWDSYASMTSFDARIRTAALAGGFQNIMQYSPLAQVEGVDWLLTCADATFPVMSSPGRSYTASRGWCNSTSVTGVTVSLSIPGGAEMGLNGMSRPLVSRLEPGNKFMYVFSGSVDLNAKGADAVGQAGKFFAFEQWADQAALDTHLKTDVVKGAFYVAAFYSAPGGVSFLSPFHEIVPC